MEKELELKDLEGLYDVTYSSSPHHAGYFQPGFGTVEIIGNEFSGVDALGVIWAGTIKLLDDRTVKFNATLDPRDAEPEPAIIDANGNITNEPQNYEGDAKITKLDDELIMRAAFKHGINTINAQFRRANDTK